MVKLLFIDFKARANEDYSIFFRIHSYSEFIYETLIKTVKRIWGMVIQFRKITLNINHYLNPRILVNIRTLIVLPTLKMINDFDF